MRPSVSILINMVHKFLLDSSVPDTRFVEDLTLQELEKRLKRKTKNNMRRKRVEDNKDDAR